METRVPFRADQVGSLLRSDALQAARNGFQHGRLTREALTAIEDAEIRRIVARQEAIGLKSITDGELRRDYWHLDFLSQFDGVKLVGNEGPTFQNREEAQPPIATVEGKLHYRDPVQLAH